jgi:predicted GNAT family acetyltransferase
MNEETGNFELRLGDQIAFTRYRLMPGIIVLAHTEVPPEFEGRGFGGLLARAALDHARAADLKVIVTCPFIAAWMRRHPEYNNLLA